MPGISRLDKELTAGKQRYRCANKPGSNLNGMDTYQCPMWACSDENNSGLFDEAGYKVMDFGENNLKALCLYCFHYKKESDRMMRNEGEEETEEETEDESEDESEEESEDESEDEYEDSDEEDDYYVVYDSDEDDDDEDSDDDEIYEYVAASKKRTPCLCGACEQELLVKKIVKKQMKKQNKMMPKINLKVVIKK